jgi:hypothetical protein
MGIHGGNGQSDDGTSAEGFTLFGKISGKKSIDFFPEALRISTEMRKEMRRHTEPGHKGRDFPGGKVETEKVPSRIIKTIVFRRSVIDHVQSMLLPKIGEISLEGALAAVFETGEQLFLGDSRMETQLLDQFVEAGDTDGTQVFRHRALLDSFGMMCAAASSPWRPSADILSQCTMQRGRNQAAENILLKRAGDTANHVFIGRLENNREKASVQTRSRSRISARHNALRVEVREAVIAHDESCR